jgi:hypothetical protein
MLLIDTIFFLWYIFQILQDSMLYTHFFYNQHALLIM